MADEKKAPGPCKGEAAKKQDAGILEGEGDAFEEFSAEAPEDVAAAAEEGGQLWEADWDDEVTGEDFQDKLKRELDRDMKD